MENKTTATELKAFNFEIYTCNETTGETGWDIKNRSVFAADYASAKQILKTTPFYDCIILFNWEYFLNDRDKIRISNGFNFRDVEFQELNSGK